MPPVVAAAAITAGAAVGSNVIGAKIQSGASRKIADTQTEAANRAAEIQARSQAEALAFQRAAAENAYRNDEAARRGNYDQWAATEARRGSIGALLGMGPRNIPAYVPGVDPNFEGGGTSGPMPVGGGPALMRTDQFGRKPGDPMYGTPVPSPRRRPAQPDASVGSMLRGEPDPTRVVVTANPAPLDRELEALAERKRLAAMASNRGTPGSVGSYLRSA